MVVQAKVNDEKINTLTAEKAALEQKLKALEANLGEFKLRNEDMDAALKTLSKGVEEYKATILKLENKIKDVRFVVFPLKFPFYYLCICKATFISASVFCPHNVFCTVFVLISSYFGCFFAQFPVECRKRGC